MVSHQFAPDQVSLLPDLGRIDYWPAPNPFHRRFGLVRGYLMSLSPANLLRNHRLETGRFDPAAAPAPGAVHGGWEAADSQLRGHFLGHWLSAAARICASGDDPELAARVRGIVRELAHYQEENGGEWVFSIPEKYLHRIAAGKPVWAPHYTVHKTLMGLLDVHRYVGDKLALEIVAKAADWFHRWTGQFGREQLDDILDTETGGMLEAWADLYGFTGQPAHRELIDRYDRPRLFDRLLAGEDPLTNRHANTTIPEILGAARAHEVTGEARWREVVLAYWRCAVTERGWFATGGQTSFELWTPPFEFAARLGPRTQEHCTVHNLMRLADVLFRWTGDVRYHDYLERNLYNGVLAQQHPNTGMAAYYLPLRAGGTKAWGTPTDSFWCCYGSMVQAHTLHNAYTFYRDDTTGGIDVGQYVPSELRAEGLRITLRPDLELGTHIAATDDRGARHRPAHWRFRISVATDTPTEFPLRLRIPEWVREPARVSVNGEVVARPGSGWCVLTRVWGRDEVVVELPKGLRTEALPDQPELVAFLDGPVVLAGLCERERRLVGDPARPAEILVPDNERDPFAWNGGYRTRGQAEGLRFVPLHEIEDETYTVYFPVTAPA